MHEYFNILSWTTASVFPNPTSNFSFLYSLLSSLFALFLILVSWFLFLFLKRTLISSISKML